MGYESSVTGFITVSPPLNAAERDYLERFTAMPHVKRKGAPYRVGGRLPAKGEWDRSKPNDVCDWRPTDDGNLACVNDYWKLASFPEWLRYLADHFLIRGAKAQGRPGFEDFTFDHSVHGDIDVEGRAAGDRWKLVAADGEIAVVRDHLPCPACWSEVLWCVRPSVAYRFDHSVREAVPVDLGIGPRPQWQAKIDGWRLECEAGAWRPRTRVQRVEWPCQLPDPLAWWRETAPTDDELEEWTALAAGSPEGPR